MLSAALSNTLSWSPQERAALNLCIREQARAQARAMAATVLGLWWRKRRKGLTDKDQDRLQRSKRIFLRNLEVSVLDIEDCADFSVKIDQLAVNSRCTSLSLCGCVYVTSGSIILLHISGAVLCLCAFAHKRGMMSSDQLAVNSGCDAFV